MACNNNILSTLSPLFDEESSSNFGNMIIVQRCNKLWAQSNIQSEFSTAFNIKK